MRFDIGDLVVAKTEAIFYSHAGGHIFIGSSTPLMIIAVNTSSYTAYINSAIGDVYDVVRSPLRCVSEYSNCLG